jgi:hypothetical protein
MGLVGPRNNHEGLIGVSSNSGLPTSQRELHCPTHE